MPLIRIESVESDINTQEVLKQLSLRISEQTSFPSDRLIILWNYIVPGNIYRHGHSVSDLFDENNELIITVTLSERNSEEQIRKLAEVITESLGDILNFDKKRISVILDIKKTGGLYIANNFI